MPNIKQVSSVHHSKEANRNEIMKLLAIFLLQGLHQKPNNSYFSWRKILDLFSERRYHLLLKFLHFVGYESYDGVTCGSKRLYKLKPILDHLNAKFRSVCTAECDVSVDECLMWQGHCYGRYKFLQNMLDLV
jgi:hypothetical protein